MDYWGAKGYVAPPLKLLGAWPPCPPPSSYAYEFQRDRLLVHVFTFGKTEVIDSDCEIETCHNEISAERTGSVCHRR